LLSYNVHNFCWKAHFKMKKFVGVLALTLLSGLALAQTGTTTTTTQSGQTTTGPLTNAAPYMLPRNAVSVGIGFLQTTGSPGFTAANAFGGLRHRGFEIAGEWDAGSTDIKVPGATIKVHEQDYLFGPRFYFSKAFSNPRWVPYAHLLFGVSRQNADITGGPENSDTAYSWSFGGGAEYHFTSKWGVRARADVFRTHFLDDSQTHGRFGGGVLYIWGR
jgi:hypothetical protein